MHEAVGRTQTSTDILDPARATQLRALLGLANASVVSGDALHPFAHHAYFWPEPTPSELGHDGHPRLGKFIPDLGLPTRMWAGGRLHFLHPLVAGTPAIKTTAIDGISHKEGRTGLLAFVTLRHEITQNGRLILTEWQDLVYRPSQSKAPKAQFNSHGQPNQVLAARFTETTLFRYSAITANGHRIHYDPDFCRSELGIDKPVVHAPLLAQMLMLLAEQNLGDLRQFEFRATAPLLAGQAVEVCWQSGGHCWIQDSSGRLFMRAEAR